MPNFKKIKFKVFGDRRGKLISLEAMRNVPFEIKRVYYIFDTKEDVDRGNHSHPKLNQIVVCLSGSCKFYLEDKCSRKTLKLNKPSDGLFIGKDVWRRMFDFSSDCVLMVLADDYYIEEEYNRDYKKFKLLKK